MTPEFHRNSQYYSNKVPLGSIRVPYNFVASSEKYENDSNKQFFFTCLSHKEMLQSAQTFMAQEEQMNNLFM